MNEIILSIIIPVYNTELYLEQCLHSCVQQDLASDLYEIIFVNDGSTDKSYEVLKRLTMPYNNVLVFNQENGGVCSARNHGIKKAKGKYIWLVDSDDWIKKDCLGNIISVLEKNRLDAIQIGYVKFLINGELSYDSQLTFGDTDIMHPQEYINSVLFNVSAWATIFKRKLAIENSIFFQENIKFGEDQLFFLNLLHYAKNIKRKKECIYYYRFLERSAINNIKEHHCYALIDNLKAFPKNYNYTAHVNRSTVWLLSRMMNQQKVNIRLLNHKLKELNYLKIWDQEIWDEVKFKIVMYKYFGIIFLFIYNRSWLLYKHFISVK